MIDELSNTPDTLWLRLMGKGRTQNDAIEELLNLPESNPKRSPLLKLMVYWRINIELLEQVNQEEREIVMALSQAYLDWEQKTKQSGRDENQRVNIVSILTTRFGAIDASLESIIPTILELPPESSTPLLIQMSREELLQRFSR